ncbi:TonB-dependent hemoglobin/transferrin/lactoferrin family receptor [Moraxella cuniculi]|uniref:Probable hemoglobin and hemoglobin-haptoglobin-binding protein 2 n=1 Tax=Moraxella cuniculi TaxID=34061 RepID=A0A448GYK3_9GAMM|nr:TonB-dependent hemoglobin/transferrin/lactoferrin family receptor [Moraxella cuniculi]VEG13867.1 Probable hemoglobin and hemoglobin-haptoglobin-binding protein 2 precursor [Moraxella cuniculi]
MQIRGVDENRVAIMVDGLHQAETLASQGFKELFEGYGNFNNTRNSVEFENIKTATIKKGADSVTAGSGALGGAVIFKTKEAQDYLQEKDWHVGLKTGYSSVDDQKMGSATAAARLGDFDALLIATRRNKNETKNYGYDDYDASIQGKTREKPDPYDITQKSTLLKLGYTANERHRFDISVDDTKQRSKGNDFSYTLKYSPLTESEEVELRHTDDRTKRQAFSLSYTNSSPNLFWDEASVRLTKQDITTTARTDDYCDGEKCQAVSNPLGLQLKNGKVVDKNGNPLVVQAGEDGRAELVANGKVYQNFDNKRVDQFWFDCSIFDCNSPIEAYEAQYGQFINAIKLDLDRKRTDPNTGKTYATTSRFSNRILMPFPGSPGYLTNLYSERDLNSKTNQLNLDLTKWIGGDTLSHDISYGGYYSTTEKSMVNKSGSNAWSSTWWADKTLGWDLSDTLRTCENFSSYNSLLCPGQTVFSFLIPVKTTDSSFYASNKIAIGDRLNVDLGYRYNRVKYQPNYVAGQTAKIPDDMVKGLFVPLPVNDVGEAPRFWNYNGGYSDPKYLADQKAYEARKEAYEAAVKANPEQNIAYLSKPRSHSQHSYSIAPSFDLTNYLNIQAKYSKGFRMPTADEMYFTFRHPDITVKPNVNLKPEIAKTKELVLTTHGKYGFLSGSIFETKYTDFIDFSFQGLADIEKNSARRWPIYQSINRQTAKAEGVEINALLNAGELVSAMKGVKLSYQMTRQKGRADGDIPMNAIQPNTSVFGVGYDAKNDKFGANLYITRVSAKKAEDTYNLFWREEGAKDSTLRWRSDGYTTVDLTGYYKPTKNLTLQAGVYNLADKKYMTWDSARSIRPFGTSNMIDKKTNQGINRFLAPGRNFKLSLEYVF